MMKRTIVNMYLSTINSPIVILSNSNSDELICRSSELKLELESELMLLVHDRGKCIIKWRTNVISVIMLAFYRL